MRDDFYSLATSSDAKSQSKEKKFRTNRRRDPFDVIQVEREELKVWLRKHALGAPQETPSDIKDLLRRLETLLGNPRDMPEGGTDFARVCTVRLKEKSLTSGPVRRTSYKMDERYDYTKQLTQSAEAVNLVCGEIIEKFLALTRYGDFVQTIIAKTEGTSSACRVYGHVDWYPDRNYKAQTWHKDTRGATLFVGLMYMNEDEIQGPDVIPNPWPLYDEMELKRTPKCMLPDWIMGPVDDILKENALSKMKVVQTGKIPAGGGMIWFIDELVHHRTPQGGPGLFSRYEDSMNLAISENVVGRLLPDDFLQEGTWDKKFTKNKKRKFVRIWITLDEVF